ncbi:MAG: methylenetetrahydrofolate reductase [NAD(P)H] [Pseudomonadaceae bacterium]|nr:methylenetetrahydrofolate reductase [NAD(P)H] [Pseudomonadaceae bacterium]
MSRLPPVSFEFFPPRDAEGRARLINNVAAKLGVLNPHFFSVTYGAGGSTRDGTRQTVVDLKAAGFDAAPHLSMGNDDIPAVKQTLDDYAAQGINRIVALRGDQPSGVGSNRFANNAQALVELIREHSGKQFHLEVAAYPETHPDAKSAAADLDHFKRKVDAGADSAITQYFYNVDAFENFLNRCAQANISLPIIPGIMPITNLASLVRFSDKCGADIPRWLRYVLIDLENDEQATIEFGVEVMTRVCEQLISLGVPGLHFYTLNRWGATTRICENLG